MLCALLLIIPFLSHYFTMFYRFTFTHKKVILLQIFDDFALILALLWTGFGVMLRPSQVKQLAATLVTIRHHVQLRSVVVLSCQYYAGMASCFLCPAPLWKMECCLLFLIPVSTNYHRQRGKIPPRPGHKVCEEGTAVSEGWPCCYPSCQRMFSIISGLIWTTNLSVASLKFVKLFTTL